MISSDKPHSITKALTSNYNSKFQVLGSLRIGVLEPLTVNNHSEANSLQRIPVSSITVTTIDQNAMCLCSHSGQCKRSINKVTFTWHMPEVKEGTIKRKL